MTFFPIASPTNVDNAARLSRYNPSFSGATLSGCELDADGNVVLFDGDNIEQTSTTGIENQVYGELGTGIRIDANTLTGTKLDVYGCFIKESWGTKGDLYCRVYDVTASVAITTKIVLAANIDAGSYVEFDLEEAVFDPSHIIDIRVDRNGGGDGSNFYRTDSSDTNTLSGITLITTNNSWGTITPSASGYEQTFYLKTVTQTTGTVTEDIAVSSIAEWYKYHRNVTTPANTSVSCVVKDTSDNVLIASLADGDSLSSIDAKTYKTVRLVHTLTRNSTSDATPKLHYREVSWIGWDFIYDKAKIKGYGAYTTNSTTTYALVGEYSGVGIASISIGKMNGGNAVCLITRDGTQYTITYTYLSTIRQWVLSDLSGVSIVQFRGSNPDVYLPLLASLAFPIAFKKSLKVEIKSSDANVASILMYTEVQD